MTCAGSACCSRSSRALVCAFAAASGAALYKRLRSVRCFWLSGTLVSSFSTRPAREDVHDGHEVFALFLLGTEVWRVVANNDVCACLREHPLQDVDSEARESVSVGNHDLADSSALRGDQKPLQAFSTFEVKATGDVFVDGVSGTLRLKRLDLPFEVVFLLARADAAVDGAGDVCRARLLGLHVVVLGDVSTARPTSGL